MRRAYCIILSARLGNIPLAGDGGNEGRDSHLIPKAVVFAAVVLRSNGVLIVL